MLRSLHVKNLALIRQTEVEFGEGLNILTGETGAGKSLLIGSVNLALGGKFEKDMLRRGEESGLVELVFDCEEPRLAEKLKSMDLEPSEDGTVILSRKLSSGKSICRINGETVTAKQIKELSELLIDIHGQHEHQSLVNASKHLEILDAYAKDALGEKKERLAACYQEYRKLKKEWESSSLDTEERARELSFLAYEVKEIEEAQLSVGEDTRLEEQYRRFANAKKIMDAISAAGAATGGDGGTGENASELISRALREVSSVSAYEDRIAQMEQMLTDIDNLLSDFNHEISSYLSGEEFDDEVFYQTEKRLDEINHLKSKYGNTMEEILQSAEEKTKRIAVLQDYDKYLNDLLTSTNRKKEELDRLCAEAFGVRQKAAK